MTYVKLYSWALVDSVPLRALRLKINVSILI